MRKLDAMRLAAIFAVFALVWTGCASEGAKSSGLVSIGSGLRGESGLRATVYARGLEHVSAFAFDSRGRLWVTTSGATDHAGDGVYVVSGQGSKPKKAIGGLKGPLGLVRHRDTLYVASLGRVDAFSSLAGTHFAKRKRILSGPSAGGENNNLVLSPDGRLLMGVSAPCDHCDPNSKWSAAIVSFRLDGGDLRVYASGIRAAYGLTYEPGTSDLLVTMNQRDDLGARTPGDWLATVEQGDDWGFPACYGQGGAGCAGVPRPLATLDKHAAAGGVAVVRGSAIVAEWQRGKVLRVSLSGAGKGSAEPFLTGLKNPLAVTTDRDGSVLVGDWTRGVVYRVATL
jgi:glucose/arabinose dehydrogenase